jgi:hypothetical protein
MVHEIAGPLTTLHAITRELALAEVPKYPNLNHDAVAEYVFEQQLQGIANQIAARVVVPRIRPSKMEQTQRQRFILNLMGEALYKGLKPSNPSTLRVTDQVTEGTQMQGEEWLELFDSLQMYEYNSQRKLINVPRYLTRLLTREQFVTIFGEYLATASWLKETPTYSLYACFPMLVTYNTKKSTGQLHFLTDIYEKATNRQIEQNFEYNKKGTKRKRNPIQVREVKPRLLTLNK